MCAVSKVSQLRSIAHSPPGRAAAPGGAAVPVLTHGATSEQSANPVWLEDVKNVLGSQTAALKRGMGMPAPMLRRACRLQLMAACAALSVRT